MSLRQSAIRVRMSEEGIEAMISRLGGLAVTLHDADPDDKSEVSQQLGLRMTYQPGKRSSVGRSAWKPQGIGFFDGVRGGHAPYLHDRHRSDDGVCPCCG